MISKRLPFRKNAFFYAFLLGTFFSLIFLALSFFLPSAVSPDYYQKSLRLLRKQAEAIKREFSGLIVDIQARQKRILASPFPQKKEDIFRLFRELRINPDLEGIVYYDKEGRLALWLGHVIDAKLRAEGKSFLVRDKTSVFLLSPITIGQTERVVLSRLLAFAPQFKTSYLEEYHFISEKLQKNCVIDYWDYREDVSGFEKTFSRHQDEYVGQPRLRNEIQSIFFPLRNGQNRIVATVNLTSPSLFSYTSSLRESLILVFNLIFGASLILLIIYLARFSLLPGQRKWMPGFLLILALIGLRLTFFPLSQLEKIQSWPIFSPALASFLSLWDFTKSPADIFLTALFLFFTISAFALLPWTLVRKGGKKPSIVLLLSINVLLSFFSLFLLQGFHATLSRLSLNSNLNLLRFSLNLPFLLLHLSILLLFLTCFLLIFMALRVLVLISKKRWTYIPALLIFLIGYAIIWIRAGEQASFLCFLSQAALIVSLVLLAALPKTWKAREAFALVFLLSSFVLFFSVYHLSSLRDRRLVQNFIRQTTLSQDHWADYLVRQSLSKIDEQKELISRYLKEPRPSDSARTLWQKTLAAQFNWYSSLEILNADAEILSSFSLNVPQLFLPASQLAPSPTWAVTRLTVMSLGKEKEFIVGYKDWFEGEDYLGRTILSLYADYEILPFLYSANPYYEILRVSSLPSLNQLDFGFAIFDLQGKLLFNRARISSGISPKVLTQINSGREMGWTTFQDKKKKLDALPFKQNNRIDVLFIPRKTLINQAVAFMKLFFFYLAILFFLVFLPGLVFNRTARKKLFWSFSNRVYASFIAIALMALLLFTFFTQNFFTRIFAQSFIERAEIHANFARNVMEDVLFLQKEEITLPAIQPEDLVLWISSAISNDINLYKEGKLASSSRQEFFDSGLLPELIDGETHYRILYENNPFWTRRQKIGKYSFQTLTVPYSFLGSTLLISLPFPFEEQEISQATQELVEFLVLSSVFFLALGIAFARGIGTMIITPIQKLLTGTREVSLGNLEVSIDHKPGDEMKTLIDGFNTMVKNLKSHQQELTEMSKKVAWAEMARKVAHEIKNPLTPIQLSAEHLLKVYEDRNGNFEKALKESVTYIISEVENLRRIAQEFLEISKDTTLHREALDLKDIIKETVSPYQKVFSERIAFQEAYTGKDFSFEGDKSKLKIALRNIIINAIEAIRGKGTIRVSLSQEKDSWKLEIRDTGMGMAKDVLDKIFEPYFSTKDVGTGLGLPIAKKIIEDHGGSIHVASEIKKGSTITMTLPGRRSNQGTRT